MGRLQQSGCLGSYPPLIGFGLPAKTLAIEAFEIQQRRPMINLDAGLLLDRSWTPYVHPRSGSHETGSVLAGSPNPIKGGSQGTPTAEDNTGLKHPAEELSSPDCVFKHS